MNFSAAANGSSPPTARVYLKLNSKRAREGFTEDAPQRKFVRVQWNDAEMGAPPAPLQSALAARTKLIFRRLARVEETSDASGSPQRRDARPAAAGEDDAQHEEQQLSPSASRTHVERVTQAGKCLLIECGESFSTAATSTGAASAALYVLDVPASEREAMHDAFGEFAITDDDVTSDLPTWKRGRGEDGADGIEDVFLAPVRRLAQSDDHASSSAAQAAAAFTAEESRWGPLAQDAEGTTWAMLQAYDETLCVEDGDAAAADLYCYPDHRKDDEYDSNAEDFSGNDYPNSADDPHSEGDGDSGGGSSTGRGGRHRHNGDAYGMFCEEGYSERSLSSGWSSNDA